MKRLPAAEEDRRSVKDWYDRWSGYVADVDFKAARPTFAEDAIAFGSKVEVMTSQAQLEAEITRNSRSTACADGRSLPGGLRRRT